MTKVYLPRGTLWGEVTQKGTRKSTLSPGGKTAFKAEFRDIDKNYIPTAEGGAVSREWAESFEDWENVSMSMVAPAAAADVVILIRLYGPGLAYYDDAILRVVE